MAINLLKYIKRYKNRVYIFVFFGFYVIIFLDNKERMIRMKKIFLLLLIGLLISGCGNNKENIKIDKDKNKETVDSVTFFNTNGKYQEEKQVDGLKFSNASLSKVNEDCLFEVTVKNESSELYTFKNIKISLLDKSNNLVIELMGLVPNGTLNIGEERVISSYYNGEIDKIYNVQYQIIK